MTSSLLLEVKNLSVEVLNDGGFHGVVDDVSFSVMRGQTLGLVGESGSGKSVTALSIMKLLSAGIFRIPKGKVVFFDADGQGTDLLPLREKEVSALRGRKISMIFQEPMTSLNPVMRCGRQVVEILRRHEGISSGEAKRRSLELFKEVRLLRADEIYNSYPHEISGGQKQRVMISMAMACRPSLLIADEPTTALDVTVQQAILALLRELQIKYGMGLVFISHDLGVVAQIAHEVAVMKEGKIVEQGEVTRIFRNPQHPYTKGLIACRPSPTVRLKILPTVGEYLAGKDPLIAEDHNIINKDERKQRLDGLYSREPVLSVNKLQTWFPTHYNLWGKATDYRKAVEGVSLEVFPGETLGLVGESGCGKTTLGRTLLNLIRASGGEIYYKGSNIFSLNREDRRLLRKEMQIIFQDPFSSLNPRLTAGEAIQEPMRVYGLHVNEKARKEKVYELLMKVGLEEQHYRRYPHEFSGGQRQRICIARALAVEPEFVVCDESVSALDISIQAQVLNLLNQLKNDFKLTYIFISHDLGVVRYMSDRIVVMKDGKIVESGDADEVYFNPQTTYTQKLIAAIPVMR